MAQGVVNEILNILATNHALKDSHNDGNYSCRCPFHEPDHHSKGLSFSFNPDKGVYFCFSCGKRGTARALAEQLGIKVGPLTVEDLAVAKGIPPAWLKEQGLARQGTIGVQILYRDEKGEEVSVRTRRNLCDTDWGKRFIWRKGDHTLPYGLWLIEEQKARWGWTILVEGETDAWTLWLNDLPGIGIPGASNWKSKWASYFDGFDKLYLWLEPDEAGCRLLRDVARDLPGLLVIQPPPDIKDVNDLWVKKGYLNYDRG